MLRKPEGLQSAHFFIKGFEYAVVLYQCTTEEGYMIKCIREEFHTSKSLCIWAIDHHIQYEIIYERTLKAVVTRPIRYIHYYVIQRQLREYIDHRKAEACS